ncbi:hypothetical protein BKA70DRAFT_610296 [Coprinopsis sp. MPI-PUGE-AT-0042]|nr:hypothetical protein BKA70DRAFT_610296 [Coprinopsis sp. MPI-PUGE-AT-0042]
MSHEEESQYLSIVGNNMITVISLTLLVAEYFHTLELEVSVIWTAPWNLVKYLYFANKILPFLVLPFGLVYNLMPDPTPRECTLVFSVPWIGITMCIMLSEAILYIRLYALSGHARWTLLLILVNGSTIFIVCNVLFGFYLARGSWGPSQFQSVPGCFGQFTNNGQLVMIGYAFLLYSVVATMVLCIYFGVRMFWSSRQSPLIKIFYRDGTFYFVVLALMSVANGVAAVFLPAGYRFILAPPQAVLHSTLSIRMVLHLRQQARCEMGLSTVRRIVHGKNPDPKLMMMSVPTHPNNEASSSHLEMGLVPRSPQFKE